MPAPRQLGLLRDWVRRVISGYWTHAGALNWDTGLGFHRWQQSKKVALAQGALLGVATAPELQPDPRWGEWAKWLLDRLVHYAAQTERADRIPDALAYGVHVVPQSRGNAYLAAARHAPNAMRALQAGLGRARAAAPPALYAFDPDTGRLAVTTPRYSTAIVAVNHRAFPYGGVDLARLLGADGQVIGTLGGTGTGASACAWARSARSTAAARTQQERRRCASSTPPAMPSRQPRARWARATLASRAAATAREATSAGVARRPATSAGPARRAATTAGLVRGRRRARRWSGGRRRARGRRGRRSPRGRRGGRRRARGRRDRRRRARQRRGRPSRAGAGALRAYAGPFSDLRVRGNAPAGTVEYRFTPTRIEARWTARERGGVVTFPSWGRHTRIRELRPGTLAIGTGYTVTVRGAGHADRPSAPAERESRPRPDARGRARGTQLSATLVPR